MNKIEDKPQNSSGDISREEIEKLLATQAYITESHISMSVFLALRLEKPLLIEGPAGVGKTEVAKVLSNALDLKLIRLQCYEGLDASQALYEWNYQRQLLHLKLEEGGEHSPEEKEHTIFGDKFLLKRPLLQAISEPEKTVLLIDEIDRADEEFESFLLELLSDWQITIPEIGTVSAMHRPIVIVTSNRVRELSEALRRRCLYLYIDYPTFEKELAIVQQKVPGVDQRLATEICKFLEVLRTQRLAKVPGIAETLDWATALAEMHFDHLDKNIVEETLGVILKDWKDMRNTKMSLSELFEKTGVTQKMN